MGPHYEALGYTLVHVSWQAVLVAGLYKLTDFVPALRSSTRYSLGFAAMLAILFLAILTFLYEEARLSLQPSAGPMIAIAPPAGFSLSRLLPWLDAAWIAGVTAMSMRMVISLWYIKRLNKEAEAAPEGLAYRFAATLRRLGLTGKVRLRLHRKINSPFVAGAFRSVVYLPVSAVTSLSPDQLDAVLAHELEHIRRADYLWNLVQSLIETLFFFHPAVWWLGARLREQRELCCDDAALKTCTDPLTYATALLCLEEHRRGPSLAMALNGQDGGRGLMARIARMLGENISAPRRSRPNAAFALPVLLLVLSAFMTPAVKVAAAVQPKAVLAALTGGKPKPSAEIVAARVQAIKAAMPETSDADASAMANRDNWDTQWNDNGIDPDAIAAEARADVERAKADIARHAAEDIDVDAIAEQARQDMQRQGLTPTIDVDVIVAQARDSAQRAKVRMADVQNLNIDLDAVAEQARAAAEQAKVQAAWSEQFGQKFGKEFGQKFEKRFDGRYEDGQWDWAPDAPATPETPAPLMDDAAPPPPAAPLTAPLPAPAPGPAALPAPPAPAAAPTPVSAPAAVALVYPHVILTTKVKSSSNAVIALNAQPRPRADVVLVTKVRIVPKP